MHSNLDELRRLRNRIAHHEPIFTRDLRKDFDLMTEIVELRSPLIASWMISNQDSVRLMSQVPLFRGGRRWTPSHEEIAQLAYRLWGQQGCREGHAESDWAMAERLLGLFD
jgi:hypothetical protein